MKNNIYILSLIIILTACSQSKNFAKKKTQKKSEKIFDTIYSLSIDKLDSVKIYQLNRLSMEEYERDSKFYTLSQSEIESLVNQLKDSTNFYGGVPMSFGFTSIIEFYSENKINKLKIDPESKKVFQEDFEIPYNKLERVESLGGAASFPFIKDAFSLFLKQLEEKIE